MNAIEASRNIAASPSVVWAQITDLAAAERVISAITKIERLDGGQEFGVGTKWRETRVMFGREATEEMEVTALEAGRSYATDADGRGAHYKSVLTVTPAGEGTLLTMSFSGKPKGLGGKILAASVGWLFAGATRKAFEKDLADIAAAAESVG